jgi:hypothetical protein
MMMTVDARIKVVKLSAKDQGERFARGVMVGEKTKSGAEVLDTRRGFPVYDRNPSVPVPSSFGSRSKPLRVNNGNRVMIVGEDNGEILGRGHAGFFEFKEVDETQFVKLYLAGMKQTTKLTAAGLQVFELVYHQMRASPQTDRLDINYYIAKKHGLKMAVQTFRRGLRELLEHEFIYRSPVADAYFVNVQFIFNGNRITLAKSYFLKGTGAQLGLDLGEPPALPSP